MKVIIDTPDIYNPVFDAVVNTGKKSLIDADEVQEKINKLLKEPDYQHEGEDWRTGLIMAEELIADSLTIIESEDKE